MSQELNAASEVGGTFDETQMSFKALSCLVAAPKLSTRDPLCTHFDRTQQYNKKYKLSKYSQTIFFLFKLEQQ
jgi:hypothetical protein